LANNFANQLQKIVQLKRHKKSKNKDPNSMQLSVRQMNEQIINILKGIIRQGQQAGAGANMSAKRLL
jgi:ribosomal protein S15P/S13E